jgi:hypothetical protein
VHNDLLEDGTGGVDWLRVYRAPGARMSSYDKILLDPVTIWKGSETNLDQVAPEDRQRIADRFFDLLYEVLAKDYTMVRLPAPGTMRLRVAITGLQAGTPVLDTFSSAVPQVRVAATLGGYATGKPVFSGQASVAFKLVGATTGQLLVIGLDGRVGQKTVAGSWNSWNDADLALEYWCEMARYRFCLARGAGCSQPSLPRGL